MSDLMALLVRAPAGQAMRKKPVLNGITLLLEGRFAEYERQAAEAQLPSLAGELIGEGDAEHRLLAALVGSIQGVPGSAEALSALAESPTASSEIQTFAAIMGGIAWANFGLTRQAATMVDERLAGDGHDDEMAALALHAGFHWGQLGEFERAAARTRQAVAISAKPRNRAREPWRTFRAVGEANLVTYEATLGQLGHRRRFRGDTQALADLNRSLAAGLAAYLRQYFKAYFEAPHVRTISFNAEDPIEAPLTRALIRCQAIAYEFGVRQAQELLGKYRLLSTAGQPEADTQGAFVLLQRARDPESLKRAMALFKAAGPLEPVRAVGEYVATGEWLAPQLKANFAVLVEAAPLLSTEVAVAVAERIRSQIGGWLGWTTGAGRLESEALAVLAAIAPALDKRAQSSLADELLRLANLPPDPALHQSMGPILHSLSWDVVPEGTRDAWMTYVGQEIAASNDHLFVAHAAASALAETDPKRIHGIVSDAFLLTPSLQIGALLLDSGAPVSAKVLRVIRELASHASVQVRDNARQGRYSLGTLRLGVMLGRIAVASGNRAALQDALELLFDESAPLADRTDVANVLAASPQLLIAAKISTLPPSTTGALPFDEPATFQAAVLKFGAAAGLVDAAQAADRLLALTTSREPAGRLETAAALLALRGIVPMDVLVAIGLTLASDSSIFVMSAAARVLPLLQDRRLSDVIRLRSLAMLRGPGDLLPSAALRGWAQAAAEGQVVPEEVWAIAEASQAHVSRHVRQAAGSLLQTRAIDRAASDLNVPRPD